MLVLLRSRAPSLIGNTLAGGFTRCSYSLASSPAAARVSTSTPTVHVVASSSVSPPPQTPSFNASSPLLLRIKTSRPVLVHFAKLASLQQQQQRDLGAHSHGHHHHHHHHHDTTYLTSKNKTDAGVRITRIGLYVNLAMAVSKGFGGWYFNSQALVADAFHALTDMVSDFMTLATVSFALKKPTDRFPNGYGKIESLGSLGVSSLLLFGGLAMSYSALIQLYAEFFVENVAEFMAHSHGHGHSHSHGDMGPNVNAAWLAAGSILIKEWLYRSTMKIAKARKSSVLASNAIHHRIDSLTSIVALLAIGGAHFLKNATYLDPVGGFIVALMVINAGFNNTKTALLELADVGLDDEMKQSLTAATQKALALLQERLAVRDVGGVKSGQNYLADLTIEVPSGMTMGDLRAVEDEVRMVVAAEVRGVRRCKIRFVEEGIVEGSEFVYRQEGEEVEGQAGTHDGDSKKST